MKRFSLLIVATIGLAAAAPGMAGERLFEDFSGHMISPKRWNGAGSDFWVLDSRREIELKGPQSHWLRLDMTAYSPQVDDGNGTGGIYGLYIADPAGIKGASYEVNVTKAAAQACPGNPSAEVVTGPEFRGRFFNAEASPTSQKGDVEVAVGFDRRPSDVDSKLTAAFIYQKCDNADCSARTTLGQGTFGKVALGSSNVVGVSWEQPRHRFVFELNGKRKASTYSVPDTSAPFAPDKEIDVARVIANCAETPRPYTSIEAYFDNITVKR